MVEGTHLRLESLRQPSHTFSAVSLHWVTSGAGTGASPRTATSRGAGGSLYPGWRLSGWL